MEKSSEIAMRHYANIDTGKCDVMTKADASPLTEADLEVDRYLYEELAKAFPDIPVVTEERSQSHSLDVSSGMFFLVDPIDGTKEFINKRDEFTVNIALLENGKPIAGVVCAPALNDCYLGQVDNVDGVNKGASLLNLQTKISTPITVSKADNEALLVVASRSHLTPENQKFIDDNNVADTKNAGSSLKFCLLAKGEADVYPRFGPTMEWDTAAGHAVLLAAGGTVNNLDGTALNYAKADFRNPNFIAASQSAQFKLS